MTKVDDAFKKAEKRGYGRGYSAGTREKASAAAARSIALREVAERAERAEAAAGIGHCENCANWEKPPAASWGWCNASRQPGSPWGCWAQGPIINVKYDAGRISTTAKFGCVLFLKRVP